jgi:hypothetical protein|tara:strand:+ start:8286 stop:8864 length:579 start_codon:yes stop_codon:yes gene_type:complete
MEDGLFKEMQQDAINQRAGVESTDTGRLSNVSDLASKIIQMENKVQFLEEELKSSKKQLLELTDQDLPAAMEEINMESFTLSDGSEVKVVPTYGGTIRADDRPQAHQWLRENGYGDIVKNTISANFGMGEDNLAKDFYQSALDRGFQVDKKEAVHPMTLKSFVKEMTENGSEFPSDLFGAFIGKKAKIVKGK